MLEDGVTGFIVADSAQAVSVLATIESFDRRRCRAVFEQRFSARRMAEDYLLCYETILADEQPNKSLLRIGT